MAEEIATGGEGVGADAGFDLGEPMFFVADATNARTDEEGVFAAGGEEFTDVRLDADVVTVVGEVAGEVFEEFAVDDPGGGGYRGRVAIGEDEFV